MEWDACFLLTPVLKKKEEFPYVLAFPPLPPPPSCCFCCCKLTTLQLGMINDAPQCFGGPEVSLLIGCTLCGKGENEPVPQSVQNPLSVENYCWCGHNVCQQWCANGEGEVQKMIFSCDGVWVFFVVVFFCLFGCFFFFFPANIACGLYVSSFL